MKREANFFGLDMIPVYIELTGGQLQEALTLLELLESCQNKPHILDDATVNRVIKQYTEQKKLLEVPSKQCTLWRNQRPTPQQLDNIEKIERCIQRLQKVTDKVLFLANHYKDHTIDRILEKDDAELAIEYLLGKLYDPMGNVEPEDTPNDKEPWGPGSPHDYKILHSPNERGVKKLYQIKGNLFKPPEPMQLAEWYQDYVQARGMINEFHEGVYREGIEDIIQIAKELGNYDPVQETAVIENDSEMNVFYDYFSLYRESNGQRFVSDWLARNSSALTTTNETLVRQYTKAKFCVLRIEKNLSHGAIHVVDVISQKSYLLIDKALN